MRVTVDLPDRHFAGADDTEVEHRLKLYTALILFQSGRLSAGAACEVAEVDRYTFLAECRRHGVPTVRYDEGELKKDLETLRSLDR